MSMVLTAKSGGEFTPHPEGIHSAVCVDVMDLGLQEMEFQGKREMKQQLRLVFESEMVAPNGVRCSVDKRFTASLHPKARLAQFIGNWRGRPVVENESIDLSKLVGNCCTLVISHKQNMVGRTFACIDAVTKPTKRVVPSGVYDPVAARQRFVEWTAKQSGGLGPVAAAAPVGSWQGGAAAARPPVPPPGNWQGGAAVPAGAPPFGMAWPQPAAAAPAASPAGPAPVGFPAPAGAPAAAQAPEPGPAMEFDPEVGF